MASSDMKIRVFFALDIQGFAKLGPNNKIHGLRFFYLALRPGQEVRFHSNDGDKQPLTVEFRFWKGNERNALFCELS